MALASDVSLRFFAGKIPIMEGALECIRAGNIPGGLNANRDFAECMVQYEAAISEGIKTLLFDPQTAGGLLISVSDADVARLQAILNAAGVPAVEIGEVLREAKPMISLVQ